MVKHLFRIKMSMTGYTQVFINNSIELNLSVAITPQCITGKQVKQKLFGVKLLEFKWHHEIQNGAVLMGNLIVKTGDNDHDLFVHFLMFVHFLKFQNKIWNLVIFTVQYFNINFVTGELPFKYN